MEHVRRWWLVPVTLGLLVVAACSRAVPGTAAAAPGGTAPLPSTALQSTPPPSIAPPSTPPPSTAPPSTAPPSTGRAAGSAPAAGPQARGPTLQADVLTDECLLDAAQLGALLGRPVRAEQSVAHRADGTRSSSCYAAAVDGPRAPLAAINVYRVRSGTPAEFVRAAGGRALAGVGEAATLLETSAGPTLQVAGPAFLVTLVVQGRSPPDDAWRTAARAALARLPA